MIRIILADAAFAEQAWREMDAADRPFDRAALWLVASWSERLSARSRRARAMRVETGDPIRAENIPQQSVEPAQDTPFARQALATGFAMQAYAEALRSSPYFVSITGYYNSGK